MAISAWGIVKALLIRETTDTSKSLQVEISPSATTATSTILRAQQTANRTILLPDASTTLSGSDTTEVLTGKTIDGDDNTILDLALTSLKTNLTDANKFLVRDGSGIVVSNTKDVPTGTVVGTSDAQVITNKDIDGGTASNTSRITVPKNTNVNLTALTRKEGTVLYDTTNSALLFDNGTTLQTLSTGTGANTTLSNLTSPTAINQDLIPGSSNNFDLGTAAAAWRVARSRTSFELLDSGTNRIALITNTVLTTPSGNAVSASFTAQNDRTIGFFSQNVTTTSNTTPVYVETGNNSNATSGNSGLLNLKTGNISNAGSSGSSGAVNVSTGTVAGSGTRGDINLSSRQIRRGDGTNFIEEQYIDAITLLAAQTDTTITVLTFAHASYEGFEMLYKVKEATSNDVRIGRLMVATDGTNVSLSDNGTETASTGITFSAAVSGADIIIRYSSGANGATLRADVKRIRA